MVMSNCQVEYSAKAVPLQGASARGQRYRPVDVEG
jgi:hypothetical protein